MNAPPAIAIKNLSFAYKDRPPTIEIGELTVQRGERVFLFGPSGTGKTTLLGLIGGILEANGGTIEILGTDLTKLRPSARDIFRGSHIGFIFQMFNLIPYLTVEENIVLPCLLNPVRRQRIRGGHFRTDAHAFAKHLGLGEHMNTRVTDLSVGQQQRVAAARALIGAPELVIADEPTSALDADHRRHFIELLFELCDRGNTTLVFVSHDQSLRGLFSRTLSLPELNQVLS